MPYADLGEFRLYYDEFLPPDKGEAGDAAPLIFLHGFTLDRRQWAADAKYLSSRTGGKSYHVLTVDARGHGKSDAPSTGYSRADRVADLLGLIDTLGIKRFHLIGLSMGGSTGIGFALKYQERLKSLTLVSTGAAGWHIGKKISVIDQLAREKGLEAARKRWMEGSLGYFREDQRAARDLLETMMREHSGAPWMDKRRGKYPSPGIDLDRVHEIRVPTLILAGEKDRVFVPLAHELGVRIPDSRVKIYEGVGHMLNLEAPDRFREDLSAFLAEVDRPQT